MRKNQLGISYLGIFALIIAAAFLIKVTAALFPAYYDDYVIDKQIQQVFNNIPKNATPEDFKKAYALRLELNNIRDLRVDDILKVENGGNGLKVHKEYQRSAPFFQKTRFVTDFSGDFEQGTSNVSQ